MDLRRELAPRTDHRYCRFRYRLPDCKFGLDLDCVGVPVDGPGGAVGKCRPFPGPFRVQKLMAGHFQKGDSLLQGSTAFQFSGITLLRATAC